MRLAPVPLSFAHDREPRVYRHRRRPPRPHRRTKATQPAADHPCRLTHVRSGVPWTLADIKVRQLDAPVASTLKTRAELNKMAENDLFNSTTFHCYNAFA